jgi:hypothetical protein
VYGYTRSWSKFGSAVSTVLAVTFVLLTNNYAHVFFFAIIPYIAGLINIMGYPKELEGQPSENVSFRDVAVHLWACICAALAVGRLRRLIVESMSFEGVYKAVADYLQPIVKNVALLLPIFIAWGEIRRSAVMIGMVYVILYMVSAFASRNSHRLTRYADGEEGGRRLLWKAVSILYLVLIPLLFFEYYYGAVIGFIALALIQNFWRPILITCFDDFASETKGATVLSIESQAKSVSTMMIAPILGMAVDFARGQSLGGEFWPVALIAAVIALFILLTPLREKGNREPADSKIEYIGDIEN